MFLVLFSIFKFCFSSSDALVEATVDKNQVRMGMTFTYTISIKTDLSVSQNAEDTNIEELEKDFEVVSQNQSAGYSSSFANGKFTSSTTRYYRYTLTPKAEGSFIIPSIEVALGDQKFKTNSINITVLKSFNSYAQNNAPYGGSTNSQPQQSVPSQGQNNGIEDIDSAGVYYFTVKAVVEKKEVYVGEQIIVSYYLMTRSKIDSPDIYKRPEFKGFLKEDLETVQYLKFENKVINGIPYNVALLSKYAVYPLRDGTQYLDSLGFRASVFTDDNGFGSFFTFSRPRQISKDSEPVKINVKKIPSQGQPASFFGAVGDFSVNVKLSSSKVRTGAPLSLFVTFKGRGNFTSIEKPNLAIPNNLEVYEVKETASNNALGGGEKIFEFVLIPRIEGLHTIDGYVFSYFDPNKAEFINKKTDKIEITASGDLLAGEQINYQTPVASAKNTTNLINNDIRYIKDTNLKTNELCLLSSYYYLFYLTGIIVFLILLLKINSKNKITKNLESVKKESNAYIKKGVSSKIPEEYLKYFSLAIINILAFKVGMSKFSEKTDEILDKYFKINRNEQLINEIKNVLNLSDTHRYKAKTDTGIDKAELLNKIKKIIENIDN